MDNVLLLKEKTAFRNKDFDENGNVRASALLRHFEQIATDHAELMGIGHDDLMKKNWIWVILYGFILGICIRVIACTGPARKLIIENNTIW